MLPTDISASRLIRFKRDDHAIDQIPFSLILGPFHRGPDRIVHHQIRLDRDIFSRLMAGSRP